MQPKIETIIFDLGGVLIDWNPRHLYRKIFSFALSVFLFNRDMRHVKCEQGKKQKENQYA